MQRTEIGLAVSSALAAALTGLLGSKIAWAYCLLVLLDLITGAYKAYALHLVESNKGGRGLYKIAFGVCTVAFLNRMGTIVPGMEYTMSALIGAFMFRELLSNVENMYTTGEIVGYHIHPAIPQLVRVLRLNIDNLEAEAARGRSCIETAKKLYDMGNKENNNAGSAGGDYPVGNTAGPHGPGNGGSEEGTDSRDRVDE